MANRAELFHLNRRIEYRLQSLIIFSLSWPDYYILYSSKQPLQNLMGLLQIMQLEIHFYPDLQQNYHTLQNMAEPHEKVFKSPINTSISKNLYSFPQSDRFQRTKESPCRKSFYNVKKGAFENRSTTFGYGNKTDLINREGVPPPGSYERVGQFVGSKLKNRGYSFGLDKRETFSREMDLANPGPGKYDRVYNNYSRISFSFRSKYEDPLQKHKNHLGPGQYNSPSALNNTGNYFNSKYRGSLCSKIGKSSRFDEEPSASPGPGKYSNNLAINRTGVYFNSKIPSNFVKSFQGTSRRPINDPSETPGPGTYYYFSQFAARSKSPSA